VTQTAVLRSARHEAIRYDGSAECAQQIAKWSGCSVTFKGDQIKVGTHIVSNGDWIVKPGKRIQVLNADLFETLYEPPAAFHVKPKALPIMDGEIAPPKSEDEFTLITDPDTGKATRVWEFN